MGLHQFIEFMGGTCPRHAMSPLRKTYLLGTLCTKRNLIKNAMIIGHPTTCHLHMGCVFLCLASWIARSKERIGHWTQSTQKGPSEDPKSGEAFNERVMIVPIHRQITQRGHWAKRLWGRSIQGIRQRTNTEASTCFMVVVSWNYGHDIRRQSWWFLHHHVRATLRTKDEREGGNGQAGHLWADIGH